MRFLLGWLFDLYINLRYAVTEAMDNAMDVWGDDDG